MCDGLMRMYKESAVVYFSRNFGGVTEKTYQKGVVLSLNL
jgi:hypothetical protein